MVRLWLGRGELTVRSCRPSDVGALLASSLAVERLAKRYPQRTLILAGFIITIAGVGVLLALVIGIKTPSAWVFAPGLLLIGLGLGAMLTPSVNIVQSSFAEEQQGEISGLSRSVSNLGSCLGTAIAGTILVAGITSTPERSYGLAMIALAVVGLIGLVASVFLPAVLSPPTAARPARENLPRPLGTT
jgi:MFS family permease